MNTLTNKNPIDWDFYKKVLRIGSPIALAQLLSSLLAVFDTFMVSVLGDNAVTAVAVGGNFSFLMIMVLFGFFSGLGIFVAQFFGAKEVGNIQKVFYISIVIGLIVSSIFFTAAFFFPEKIISLFNHGQDETNVFELSQMGVSYLKVVAWSYPLMAVSFAISMVMRSVERVWYPQFVAIGIVLINTLLNYLLIEGNYGFPNLGVRGAAIATTTANLFGLIMLVGFTVFTKSPMFKVKLSLYKEITLKFFKKLASKALPVALNETFWGLGMSTYLIAYGFISTEAISSVHISNQIMGLFWVVNAGVSSACAIMIGKKLGENHLQKAKEWGHKFVKLSFVFGIVFGVILFLLSDTIAYSFKGNSITVQRNASMILKVFSFYLPIKFLNALHIIGTLRSGGDTRFAFMAEAIPLWFVAIPLAFVLSIYTSIPIYLIVLIVNIEEIIKQVLLFFRFRTYKWVKNLTE